jgi:hypothetical protein
MCVTTTAYPDTAPQMRDSLSLGRLICIALPKHDPSRQCSARLSDIYRLLSLFRVSGLE